MAIYDLAVSGVENYLRYCNRLKRDAQTLATYVTPSEINQNKRMASDEAILRQIALVQTSIAAVEMMEKSLGIKDGEQR